MFVPRLDYVHVKQHGVESPSSKRSLTAVIPALAMAPSFTPNRKVTEKFLDGLSTSTFPFQSSYSSS